MSVIVRVLTVNVRPGKVGAFNALFRRQLRELREQPGLRYAKLARRLDAQGGEQALLFEEWEDADSLYHWVGRNLSEPRLIDGARELADSVTVFHFEALEGDDGEGQVDAIATAAEASGTA